MIDIVEAGDEFLRDYVVAGVPASGINQPAKAAGRAAFAAIASAIQTIAAGVALGAGETYATVQDLEADLTPVDGSLGIVLTGEGSGVYAKSGETGVGEWTSTGLVFSAAALDALSTFIGMTLTSTPSPEGRFAVVGENDSRFIDITEGSATFPGWSVLTYACPEPRFDVVDANDNRINWTDGALTEGGESAPPSPDSPLSSATTGDEGLLIIGGDDQLLFRATGETQAQIDLAHGNRSAWANAANRGLRRALAKIERNQQARMAIVGDSIAMGYFGGGDGGVAGVNGGYFGLEGGRAGSWPSIMARRIQNGHGVPTSLQSWFGGGRIENLGPNAPDDPANPTITTLIPGVTLGAGWSRLEAQPTAGGYLYRSNGATTPLGYTPDAPVSSALIYAPTGFPGGVDIKVNGVTVASRAGGGSSAWANIAITFPLSMPLIEVVPQSSANVAIAGIIAWAADYGALQVINLGTAGWSTRDWKNQVNGWAQLNALIALACDHYAIALGANDIMSRIYTPGDIITPEETEANLTTMVTALRPIGQISLSLPFPISPAAVAPKIQQQYGAAIRRVADRFGLLATDQPAHFGSWANASGDMWAIDGVHPGYLALADIGDLHADAHLA